MDALVNRRFPLLSPSGVRRHVHAKGKKVSQKYLEMLHRHVASILDESCSLHNGGSSVLSDHVAAYVIQHRRV